MNTMLRTERPHPPDMSSLFLCWSCRARFLSTDLETVRDKKIHDIVHMHMQRLMLELCCIVLDFFYEFGFKSYSRYSSEKDCFGISIVLHLLEGSEIDLCMYVPGLTDFTEVLVGKVVRVDCYALYVLPDTAREM